METTTKTLRTTLCGLALITMGTAVAPAQNSTRKVRPPPSEAAAEAGQAISWRTELDTALKEGAANGKPVFWYVPTLAGSPMDRKDVVDRSMMAGPFSWPRTITLLEEHFVPVKEIPGRALMKRYGLRPTDFIEPGYLILDSRGKELDRRDEISTFHPAWFLGPLAEVAGQKIEGSDRFPGTLEAEVAARCFESGEGGEDPESLWLRGAGAWSRGEDEAARLLWTTLKQTHAGHPLAAKAAMELEGHGPYVAGFEVYTPLPEAARVPSDDGSRCPGVYSEDELFSRSAAFLRHVQRGNGGVLDSRYDFGGTDSLPNVYTAITAIVAIGLLEAIAHGVDDAETEAALQRALEYASDDVHMAKEDRDERVWVHLYRVRLYSRWMDRRPQDAERMQPMLAKATADLVKMQAKSGAWFHEYPNPFVTAQSLVALAAAKEHGARIPEVASVIEKGVAALVACKTRQGGVTYYYRSGRKPRSPLEENVGRGPLGAHALMLWKVGKAKDVATALEHSFENQDHLLVAQKYDDHSGDYAYGGFFFWYDLWVRTEAILALPKGASRQRMLERQKELILSLPEYDGAFVDSHELGRGYGTGMALWCLGLLEDV